MAIQRLIHTLYHMAAMQPAFYHLEAYAALDVGAFTLHLPLGQRFFY